MFTRFYQTLFLTGRAELAPGGGKLAAQVLAAGSGADERREVTGILRRRYERMVLEMPGEPTPFHLEAALWGSLIFFRASAFLALREIGEKEVAEGLSLPMPDPTDPAAHFSADLCLRYLPEIHRMACGIAFEDPLVKALNALAAQVPLSSVGIDGVTPTGLPGDERIRRWLAERALACRDRNRFTTSPELRQLARTGLGAHHREFGHGMLTTEST